MFKAICVSSGKSAKATLIHSAVHPVVASDTHKTTARTAFIIEFECITFLRIRFGFEREFESEKQGRCESQQLAAKRPTTKLEISRRISPPMPNARTVTSARPGSGSARPHKSSASETLAITTASVCLITFVEIDCCATRAVACMTGCALGQARAVKFRNGGRHRLSPRASRSEERRVGK